MDIKNKAIKANNEHEYGQLIQRLKRLGYTWHGDQLDSRLSWNDLIDDSDQYSNTGGGLKAVILTIREDKSVSYFSVQGESDLRRAIQFYNNEAIPVIEYRKAFQVGGMHPRLIKRL